MDVVRASLDSHHKNIGGGDRKKGGRERKKKRRWETLETGYWSSLTFINWRHVKGSASVTGHHWHLGNLDIILGLHTGWGCTVQKLSWLLSLEGTWNLTENSTYGAKLLNCRYCITGPDWFLNLLITSLKLKFLQGHLQRSCLSEDENR